MKQELPLPKVQADEFFGALIQYLVYRAPGHRLSLKDLEGQIDKMVPLVVQLVEIQPAHAIRDQSLKDFVLSGLSLDVYISVTLPIDISSEMGEQIVVMPDFGKWTYESGVQPRFGRIFDKASK